jgi:hypothetical protein
MNTWARDMRLEARQRSAGVWLHDIVAYIFTWDWSQASDACFLIMN